MFCMQCGRELPDTAKFCGACGAPTGHEVRPKPVTVIVPEPPAETPEEIPAQPAAPKKAKCPALLVPKKKRKPIIAAAAVTAALCLAVIIIAALAILPGMKHSTGLAGEYSGTAGGYLRLNDDATCVYEDDGESGTGSWYVSDDVIYINVSTLGYEIHGSLKNSDNGFLLTADSDSWSSEYYTPAS